MKPDYDVGDLVVCIDNKGCEPRWTIGWKYLVEALEMHIFPSGNLTLGAKMYGNPRIATAYSFRKFDPKTNEDDAVSVAHKALEEARARVESL